MTETLLPCPFCGGDAEQDYQRPFRHLSGGKLDHGAAVYCTKCNADMMMCRSDLPEMSDEERMAILVENWNRRASLPTSLANTYPQELTDELRDVLSLMMCDTGPIAAALRFGGSAIPPKAELEQAHVMHWLILLVLTHGRSWREKAQDRINEIRDGAKSDVQP